jgi:hypothetical protein
MAKVIPNQADLPPLIKHRSKDPITDNNMIVLNHIRVGSTVEKRHVR